MREFFAFLPPPKEDGQSWSLIIQSYNEPVCWQWIPAGTAVLGAWETEVEAMNAGWRAMPVR